MIKTTSRVIEDYSLRAQLFPSANRKKRIEEMKAFMGTLFAILDIKVHEHVIKIDRTSEHGSAKARYLDSPLCLAEFNTSTLTILKKLATAEQLKELEAYCAELFQLTAEGHSIEDICNIHDANQSMDALNDTWGTEDLGTGPARRIQDLEALKASLELNGPRSDRQLGFLATERDKMQRYTSWDPQFQQDSDWRKAGNIVPLTLQEQQLDGIYSMCHMLFTPTPGRKSGILVADAMGVGKTG
jgi:hypothetical protein